MRLLLILTVLALVACGGARKDAEEPAPVDDGLVGDVPALEDTESPYEDVEEVSLPPEKMEEISLALKKREVAAGRCFGAALEKDEIKSKTKGYVTVTVTFGTAGAITSAEVAESTLGAPGVESCVVEEVKRASVSPIPEPFRTSYTYRFERGY